MYTLKVGNAEQYQDIDQDETRLRVPFQILRSITDEETGKPILKEGEPTFEVMLERIESFPLETSQDDILATLKRHLTVFTDEKVREEESKERQAALDAAQKTAGEISNIVIE